MTNSWKVRQFDFNNAFFNGDLHETVHMVQPKGYELGFGLVYKLEKALYRLKQVPHAWYLKLSSTLHQFGFKSSTSDSCLFVHHSSTSTIYLFSYADNILVTGPCAEEIEGLIRQLHVVFTLKDLGEMSFFFGVEVVRSSPNALLLKQSKYIKELLGRANMRDSKLVPTPMLSSPKLTATPSSPFHNPSLYRSVVGGLQYTTITHPEIAYSVSKVSQYMHAPTDKHWKAFKRILHFLARTINMGLQLHKSDSLRVMNFCDSDWATDTDDCKSVSGYCVFFGSNLITWSSRKKQIFSRSSTEAEFQALADAMTDTIWLQKTATRDASTT
ncbi:uncharacterized mitochondrial protein AtMg00810-like [Arachis hypogaea]|uniref:uncharacterized mitochondrial protein AtMg00810-like n=1 Tax=Arachis hypogaea TaxID=3818 RepID=UPI000DEC85C3|nr:uncharacterized protein LOC112792738 [Arachis hypogaea]